MQNGRPDDRRPAARFACNLDGQFSIRVPQLFALQDVSVS
jgi:hypothetical protein